MRKRRISEAELSLIAQNLGSDWMLLGEILGLRKSRLQQIQMQFPYSVPTQIQTVRSSLCCTVGLICIRNEVNYKIKIAKRVIC